MEVNIVTNIDGSLGIPKDKLHLLNKSEDENWLYTPPELGGGVTALFDGFHQVHCIVSYSRGPSYPLFSH